MVSQPALSGLIAFGTTQNGTYNNLDWNTVGGDAHFNLYVAAGDPAGAFINGGDDATTSISQPLSVGTYTYSLFADGGFSGSYLGLNLFFDGGATNPGISVFAPISETTAPSSAFAADSKQTPVLGPSASQTPTLTPGA